MGLSPRSQVSGPNSLLWIILKLYALGIYFGITIFLERWPMRDCAYHVPKLRKAKFKAHDVVDFGGQLQWDLREFQRASHINFIVQGKRRLYSNFLQEKQNNRS
jgi:hypothetical protein